jgi:hypothetical protein
MEKIIIALIVGGFLFVIIASCLPLNFVEKMFEVLFFIKRLFQIILEKIKFSYKYYCVPEEEFIKGILNFRDDIYEVPNPVLRSDNESFNENVMIPRIDHYLDLEDEGKKQSIKIFSVELLQKLQPLTGQRIVILCKKYCWESTYKVSEMEDFFLETS